MATEVMEQATRVAAVMETETKVNAREDADRTPYLFTAEQVLKMVEAEILPEDRSTELLDGVLYQVTRHETHNLIVGEIGDALRPLIPAGSHLREEKPSRRGDDSLPEPDVAVCRGTRKTYWPNLPTLENLSVVVEVSHNSKKADHVIKFAMYAAAGVPYYWIVEVERRSVAVWSNPATREDGTAGYETLVTYRPGQAIPVIIDGVACGEIAVFDIFPPEPKA